MIDTCPPPSASFGATHIPHPETSGEPENKARERLLILAAFAAVLGLVFVTGIAREEAVDFARQLLLLTPKMPVFVLNACTTVSNAVASSIGKVCPWVPGSLAVFCLLRQANIMANRIEAEKLLLYGLVVDQFEDCSRCAHMALCPKSSDEKMTEIALRCRRDFDLDLFALQRQASRSLRRARVQVLPEPSSPASIDRTEVAA